MPDQPNFASAGSVQKCYNKLHLLHQAHVRAIAEVPGLKEGNGKELGSLHVVCREHLQALQTVDWDESHWSAMFEWQKNTQENLDVPHYAEILQFINLWAKASKIVFENVQNATSSL